MKDKELEVSSVNHIMGICFFFSIINIEYFTNKHQLLFKTGSYFEDEIEVMNELISSKYKTKNWLYLR